MPVKWTIGELIDELEDYDKNREIIIHDYAYDQSHTFVIDDENEEIRLLIQYGKGFSVDVSKNRGD